MGSKLRLGEQLEGEGKKPRLLGHSSAIQLLVLLVLVMGAVAGCGREESRAKPPHMGAFLRVEGQFIEMPSVKGRDFDADALPVFEGGRPTIWLWHEGVHLNLLNLREQTVQEPIPYQVTRNEEGIYILEVREDLGPGTYCLVQGDPFLLSDMLSRWCFRVESGVAGSPQTASTDEWIPTGAGEDRFEVLLQADPGSDTSPAGEVMDATIRVVDNRLDALVGTGYRVQRRGSDRILVSVLISALDEQESLETSAL